MIPDDVPKRWIQKQPISVLFGGSVAAWRFTHPGLVLVLLVLGLAVSCSENSTGSPGQPEVTDSGQVVNRFFTIGDIDPEDPTKKIERFKPLADFMASELADFGFMAGRVMVAKDTDEMAEFIERGDVDLYFDSPFPTLVVEKQVGSKIILVRWKDGVESYSSTFVVLRDSGINSLDDLVGQIVAFKEPHSTSGFVLPAGTLVDLGYDLTEVESINSILLDRSIGYVFSLDEENTFDMLLRGEVAAGGVSVDDFEELSADLKERITTVGQTVEVPRQLASVSPALDAEVVTTVTKLLIDLKRTENGRALLAGIKKTSRFARIGDDQEGAMTELRRLMVVLERALE